MTSPNPTAETPTARPQADENIEALKEINEDLVKLANAIPVLDKPDIIKHLNRIQGKAANLAQRVVGWHKLAKEKRDFLQDE